MSDSTYSSLEVALETGYEIVQEIEGQYVIVTELSLRNDREEKFLYIAPTHWGHDGIVRLSAKSSRDQQSDPVVHYSYGSGGWAKGFHALEYADAVATAHRAAAERIAALQPLLVVELNEKIARDSASLQP
jgi:hypothetical protein